MGKGGGGVSRAQQAQGLYNLKLLLRKKMILVLTCITQGLIILNCY